MDRDLFEEMLSWLEATHRDERALPQSPVEAALGRKYGSVHARDLHRGLVAKGWHIGHWPQSAGGLGWGQAQSLAASAAFAQADVPEPDIVGRYVVGPYLIQHGTQAQQAHYLDSIALLSASWCYGACQTPPFPTYSQSSASLSGTVPWVAGAEHVSWLLIDAVDNGGESVGVIVERAAPGVSLQPLPMMGQALDISRLELSVVGVDPVQVVQGAVSLPRTPLELVRSVRLDAALTRLDECLEAESLQTEFATRRSELGVDLDGLRAMELRVRADGDEALSNALALRAAVVGQSLTQLLTDALAYQAIPYPDEVLLSNEGLIGSDVAQAAVRRALFERAWDLFGDTLDLQGGEIDLKARLAAAIGLSDE